MKNLAYTPPAEDKFSEMRLITRSLILLSVVTGILYVRVFITSGQSLFDGEGQKAVGPLLSLLIGFAVCGLLIAWWREGLGGLLTLLSGLTLGVLTYLMSTELSWLTGFFYGSPFIITGVVCLFSWWRKRAQNWRKQ